MNLRKGVYIAIGVVLLGLGAWLRGSALAGGAQVLAELEAAPKSEGAANTDHVRAENEGRLVLARGAPQVVQSARDAEGKVVSTDSLVLVKQVERWKVETKKDKDGRSSTSRTWETTGGGETGYAQARLGVFELTPDLLDGLDATQPFVLDAATLERLGPKEATAPNVVFFGSGNPGEPNAGDLRITFTHAPLTPLSVLARQRGARLERYTRNLDVLGFPLSFAIGVAAAGEQDGTAMLAKQRQAIRRAFGMPMAIGWFAATVGGYFVLAGLGGFGPYRPAKPKRIQLAIAASWLLAGFVFAPLERFAATLTAQPALLVAASLAIIGGLNAAVIVAHRRVGARRLRV